MRNLDDEFAPNDWRRYNYDFDLTVRRALLERWSKHFKLQGSSLEMGSFDGSMTELILDELRSLDVIEGSATLASLVEERFAGRVQVHNVWFEQFSPSNEYDNIFLVHALEHVENPAEVLRLAAGWLSDAGKLFVAVPNANALSRQIAVRMGVVPALQAVTEGEKLHGHLRTYNLDTLRREALDAGLRISESGGVILKTLSNSQFDRAVADEIVSGDYIRACDELSLVWPDFSSSIFLVLSR